ncbi:hypothetical protein GCM10011506_43400 [Marivirga lumbricoides]|uniref:histidine kinase n=2 Tax=Marivirga lumbricoides TaxID=1046115 RepID=A0ABQ1N4J8_9BACT|nr:hypothetical protein GCM10011506_43400 [Marivirga lumbricoides]
MLEYFTMSTFGIGMMGMAFGFINLGSKRIKKHNDFLEEMVKDRTLVLEQKHQELIHQNEHYKIALNMIREQKDEIEVAQKELLAKNIEVTEALEEISAQNELIDVERTKLHQAQKIIKTQNAKLLSIARNLDQQVQERTRELSVSNNLLLEKNKELDDFIYKSAHDLRGPIARFKGLSSLINLEYKLGNNITDHLEHLDDSASQMDSMLKRLSNVYEINAKPVSIQQMKIDEVISGVLRQLQVEANYPVVNIKIDNECRRTVLCDPNLLQLIFRNLIGNAIRFADLGKAEKHVNVVVKQEEKQLKIIVKDNGLGIKEEHREKIFGLFFVGSEVTKGPGLGLYISRMISKKLNGSIELLSTDSTDETIFQVVIPI